VPDVAICADEIERFRVEAAAGPADQAIGSIPRRGSAQAAL